MSTDSFFRRLQPYLFFCFVILVLAGSVHGVSAATGTQTDPSVYLDFNEGSGTLALDGSGHGNTATIVGATRTGSGGCGSALLFNGAGDYAALPFTARNHPEKAITVSTWFYVDSFTSQVLVSSYEGGGYWLGFGDGDDLWWVVDTETSGVVTVPVQHEGITPRRWHHVTGTYDGQSARIYLDGVLSNRVNASGPIHYEHNNYVLLGADAGPSQSPDPVCPLYLKGGLDEVRIYDTALEYGMVMDDRFRCSAEPGVIPQETAGIIPAYPACMASSGSLHLDTGETVVKTLRFSDMQVNGTWQIAVPAGSKLLVGVRDLYVSSYPDSWYIRVMDGTQRVDRAVVFPHTNNPPVGGVISSGNATVFIRYFDGMNRFPASVGMAFQCEAPPPPPPMIPRNILSNPGIVIYSASWATLIAVLVVVIWLHRRKTKDRTQEPAENRDPGTETCDKKT